MRKLLPILFIFVIGCGVPKTAVNGKISYTDGTTLPTGTRLRFDPAEGANKPIVAKTNQDGSFTAKIGLGKYVVILLAPETDKSGDFYKQVPKEYYDGGALSVEVKPDSPLDLKVKK